MEFTKEQLIALISEAGEWAEIYEHPIHDKPQRDFFEGMARALTAYLAVLTTPPAPVVSDYPETLPCPVSFEPGLKFGKGVPTKTMLSALQRRSEYYAELEAMTPEQRTQHDAGMKEITAVFRDKADQQQNQQQNISDERAFAQIDPQITIESLQKMREETCALILKRKEYSSGDGGDIEVNARKFAKILLILIACLRQKPVAYTDKIELLEIHHAAVAKLWGKQNDDNDIALYSYPWPFMVPDEIITLIESLKPEYGMPGSRDIDITAKRKAIDEIVDLLRKP